MIAPLFHAWERRLASVTTNRVVRPFDWGLDWIPHNGHTSGPFEHIRGWVDEVMRDTTAFFDAPPTHDYELEDDVLRFPSAVTTPHPTNNTVYARWFPAHVRRGFTPRRAGRKGPPYVVVVSGFSRT